jgi:hypothetical protein
MSASTKHSANRVRQALKLAAMGLSRSQSALGALNRQMCTRMDKPRANTAAAHKVARIVYFMLTRREAFADQRQQRYEEQQCERSVAALKRRGPGFPGRSGYTRRSLNSATGRSVSCESERLPHASRSALRTRSPVL